MRRLIACFGAMGSLAIIAGLLLSTTGLEAGAPTGRQDGNTYLIPGNDGYGIAECIAGNKACGKRVADAWCLSKGHGKALAYGVADRTDFTGSVPPARAGASDDMPLVVTCGK